MKKYRKIYIEVTNICNLDCSFCPKTKRAAKFMSYNNFTNILEKVYDKGEKFYLHVMGEALLHPEIDSILTLCKDYKLNVNITTNGTLLNNANIDCLPTSMCISLHSFEKNDTNFTLEEYLSDIVSYCKKVENKDTYTELRLWSINQENINEENNVFLLAYLEDKLNLEINLKEVIDDYFKKQKEGIKNRRFNIKLKDKLYLSMAKEFTWPNSKEVIEKEVNGFCYGLRNQIAILVNGDVSPCCLDSEGEIKLGNLLNEDFNSIISSNRAKALYDGFTNNKAVENLCKSCGYMKMYYKN